MPAKSREFGYDCKELACWGDRFDIGAATGSDAAAYCLSSHDLLAKHDLKVWAISRHMVGQAVLDRIDARNQAILPAHVRGNAIRTVSKSAPPRK